MNHEIDYDINDITIQSFKSQIKEYQHKIYRAINYINSLTDEDIESDFSLVRLMLLDILKEDD